MFYTHIVLGIVLWINYLLSDDNWRSEIAFWCSLDIFTFWCVLTSHWNVIKNSYHFLHTNMIMSIQWLVLKYWIFRRWKSFQTWTMSPLSCPVTIRSSIPFHIKEVTFGPLAGIGKLIIVFSERKYRNVNIGNLGKRFIRLSISDDHTFKATLCYTLRNHCLYLG